MQFIIPILISYCMVFMACSGSSFNGAVDRSVGKKSSTKESTETKQKNPDDDTSNTSEEKDVETDSAVVATLPENVAGAYLSCITDPKTNTETSSFVGCVAFDQARTTKLNLAGLSLEWIFLAKDSGQPLDKKSLPLGFANTVQGLFEIEPGLSSSGFTVQLMLKGINADSIVTGEFPDPIAGQIPYMQTVSLEQELAASLPENKRHLIFVTAEKYGPNPMPNTNKFSGTEGADRKCAEEAAGAGLTGDATWKAILGDSKNSVFQRISVQNPVYTTADSETPIFAPDGKSFFEAKLIVIDGPAGLPVFGAGDSSEAKTWTGVANSLDLLDDQDEERKGETCADWTSPAAATKGSYSIVSASDKWLSDGEDTCTNNFRLLCISQ